MARTEEWHQTILDDFNNRNKTIDETIDELKELISQQETAYNYSNQNLGGVCQGLLVLMARNYFELGALYEQQNEYQQAFTNYIRAIERYVLCYQILMNENDWDETRIQRTYQIDYWIASVFSHIGDMGEIRRIFRANSFVSSRSFYNLFQETADSYLRECYAYSIYFAGHSAYKTALALCYESPNAAIKYAESAKDYYSYYMVLPADIINSEFEAYCVIAIEQLNELIATLNGQL